MSSEEPLSEAGALPMHVGIIMDGNGRWAAARGRARTYGHREGLKAAKRVVTRAAELGLSYLSLYTFSTENWRRAQEEVSFLMVLIRTHLRKELAFYRDLGIRVIHSGDRGGLPSEVLDAIELVTSETAHFGGLTLNLAINYGGRDEIVRAVNRWLATRKNGSAGSSLTQKDLSEYLDQPNLPSPDLIIRTGGEHRLSNFLLWEGAYAELYFSSLRWPDWDGDRLAEAVREYQCRRRTFGGKR
jgi:undecaprenyl diphosphate synthase